MRIHELEIDHFGVWKNVTIPFHDRGVTVLYGPNEAGKSTLMRFVRGVLYGYQPGDELDANRRQERVICSGTLKVSHQGQAYRIRRVSENGTRGLLEINGQRVSQNDSLVQKLLGSASESLFKDIFAIGLTELQQLATLTGDEVAAQIYGLSLGREGEQIVRAQNAFFKGEQFLVDNEHRKGEVFSLIQQLAELDRELERIGQPAQRHTRLNDQIQKHDVGASELRRRQSNFQQDLRGYQFLNQVWEPWANHREIQQQLDRLPVTNLDIELLNRFDDMELELSEVDSQRQHFIEEAKRLQKQSEEIKLRPELEEETCAVQNLNEQTREMQEIEQRLQGRQKSGPDPRDQEIQRLLTNFDGRWDVQRLQATDISPTKIHELLQVGDAYRQANRSRSKGARKYKKRTAELKSLEQQQRGLGDEPVDKIRDDLNKKIDELENLRGLRIRKEHLEKTTQLLPEMQEAEAVEQELPPFFYYVLWFFAAPGAILFIAGSFRAMSGMVAGGAQVAIIGACYALLGLGSLGLCWTMKQHFSRLKVRFSGSDENRERIERELARVDAQIHKIKSSHLLHPQRTAPQTLITERDDVAQVEEALAKLRQQLHDLSNQSDVLQRLESLRRSMSKMRSNLQEYQKRISRTRSDWSEALRRFGLSETLKVGEAVAQCQQIANAKSALDKWNQTHHTEEQQQRQLNAFLEKVQQLSNKIEGRGIAIRDPYQLLSEWHREVQLLGERRRERTQLRETAKEKRREASRLVDKIERMREQRGFLLSQLGVSDRGEIAAKLAAIDGRKTLQTQFDDAQQKLDKVVGIDSELVITEEMLIEYEEEANRQQIADIRTELQEIDEALQVEYQKIGKLKQEVHDIEKDRSVASLRFDREQVADSLREASESLFAYRVADRVVGQLRERIERERQPETLQAASEYLNQLTCGKYRNVWTPLGERILLVDDDAEQSLRVEQLSSGTREQVFLALRLAMIRDFATQGVELPLILDDVTVNFDQMRTEAAVETLLKVADNAQQVMLFTCHLHLAHLFENEGVEPVWLPTHRPEVTV